MIKRNMLAFYISAVVAWTVTCSGQGITRRFSLTARLPVNPVQAHKPVNMELVLTNECCAPFTVRREHPGVDYTYSIKDANGKGVNRTQRGKALIDPSRTIFRNSIKTLGVGDSVEDRIRLDEIFELTKPGTYSISVFRSLIDVADEGKKETTALKVTSNDL